MVFRYGFELECYYNDIGTITIPPVEYPHDGMVGIVELRTNKHHTLEDAYFGVIKEALLLDFEKLSFISEHTFTPQERRELRKRNTVKTPCSIESLYDYKPKALGNKTIASLQINISNLIQMSHTDSKGSFHPDTFGILDVPKIVKNLDTVFASEIKAARRQKGEYCIKGNRLEYRSLPNYVFTFNTKGIKVLLEKIRTAVEIDFGV